jgi:hypothetical protein
MNDLADDVHVVWVRSEPRTDLRTQRARRLTGVAALTALIGVVSALAYFSWAHPPH